MATKLKLLTGGNPQIAKGYGNAPVKAYIAAMPGWKRALGRRLFRGRSLRPLPPGESKQKTVRSLNIYEDDELDEDQLTDWVQQAARLPGEKL